MEKTSQTRHPRVAYAFDHFSKPYLNKLSPGCRTCGAGTWACLFIGRSCTRRCFFCLQEQKEAEDFAPYVDGDVKFDSVQRFIQYLRTFHFDGVSFSGGEPFLALDRVLQYIRAIRDAFGTSHYIWVYTNGDAVTEGKLKLLEEAGLDEIRFDVAARDYDLKPLLSALNLIPTVTVEIPAIPEDIDKVKSLLPELQSIGVQYVNLHQLMANDYNRAAFAARGYTISEEDRYSGYFPVPESESAALELLDHAAENGLLLGINYCSRLYKHLFQEPGFRRRYGPLCKSDDETITSTGFLRSLSSPSRSISDASHMDLIDSEDHPVRVIYTSARLTADEGPADEDFPFMQLSEFRARLGKFLCAEFELSNQTAKLIFQLLFVDRYSIVKAIDELMTLFELGPNERQTLDSHVRDLWERFAGYEYTPQDGSPEGDSCHTPAEQAEEL